MGASLFQGLGYGLATAGKGVGHAFQYANNNIPGGFRGAAVRILTQDPLAGRPPAQADTKSINIAQPPVQYPETTAARVWAPGQAQGDMSGQVFGGVNRSAVPSNLWSQQPAVPVPTGSKQSGAAAWYQSRYGRPGGYAYDSRYPGSYPMDERYPGYNWRRGY